MTKTQLGTLNWARATKGKMTFWDQLNYIRASVSIQLKAQLPALDIFRTQQASEALLEQVKIPDTPIVREAQAYARDLASDDIFYHSLRAYFWGILLKVGEEQSHASHQNQLDEETFYLSCLFHDLGLTQTFHGKAEHAGCFTLDSQLAADQFMARYEIPAMRQHEINNAITLHLNPIVSGSQHGWVAHYLNAGTACDVVGARLGQITKADRQQVLKTYPRGNLKSTLVATFKKEAQIHPCSRIAFMNRFGFLKMINNAPYSG